jgi:trigger factor
MQVSVETTAGLERRLTIVVPSQQFEGQITSKLTEARGQIRIPGFRPGKVPLKEVRRRYGSAVRTEVAGEIMQSRFVEAVQQEELSPAGSPQLEVVKMDPGIDFEFTATFEVFPPIELANFDKIEVTRAQAEIGKDDLDDMVERLRTQRLEWHAVDRAVAEGDRVKVDFEGKIDGEAFAGGQGNDITFEVGAGQMIEDFDLAVRGLAAGEHKVFQAIFPEDYQAEELKGKTAEFDLTLTSVEASQLPEIDDAFLEAFGVEDGGLEAFHEEVTGNMQREMDAAITDQVKRQVMDQLGKLHDVQLPHALVHQEIHVLKDQMAQQMQSFGGGAQQGELPSLPDDLFRERAEQRVAVGLIVNEIIADRQLSVDAEKVKARIEKLAEPYAEPQQVVNWYYSNEEQLRQIEMAVLEDQVVDHVLEQASVDVLQSNYADILAGKTLPTDPQADGDARASQGETPADDA